MQDRLNETTKFVHGAVRVASIIFWMIAGALMCGLLLLLISRLIFGPWL